ncbi:MAG: ATP-dependent DNA helicase RecG [Candidatus Saccharibacteria bacterium]
MSEWHERPIGSVKGVGAEMEQKLARLKIYTAGDLITHFPRRYDDFSQIIPIREMKPGNVTFRGVIERVASRYARTRKLHITEAIISDGTGTIKAIWFNQQYLAKSLPMKTEVMVSGNLLFKNNDLALQSPAIEAISDNKDTKDTARIVPIYPETEGLSSKVIRGLILPLLPLAATIDETLPQFIVDSAALISRTEALREIHFPTDMETLAAARNRLAFEELWFLMLASLTIKHEIMTETAPAIEFKAEVAQAFTAVLSFDLTDSQRKAAWEILMDLKHSRPMNRLLEGDVGSGKTVISALSAVMVMSAGYQVSLMAPTELLARQHYKNLSVLLEKLGYETLLVLGKQTAAERKAALSRIESAEPMLVIGTQALIGDKVTFPKLGLAMIDEQHRFGVVQRQELKAKAGLLPHLLSMTATPIPRTLQLTVYGDLDISVIEGLPPGRKPIKTKVVGAKERAETEKFINAQIEEGRQVYVVCPLVEASEMLDAKAAVIEAERLANGPFKHRRIGLIHGKLSSVEKQTVMENFALGQIDILVATSVIEVGIDVPNAAIMLIEGAERFGLAALHQIRGRVGRGEHASFCFLVTDSRSATAAERLGALEKSQDGFRLAQIDLELRGPGQIYGRRQSGDLDLQFADTTDAVFLSLVRNEALNFLKAPDSLMKYPEIAAKIQSLKAVTSLD